MAPNTHLVKPVNLKLKRLSDILEPIKDERPVAAKVMATIGPASRDPKVLRQMLLEGMTAARFDLNWGSLDYHLESARNVHRIAMEIGKLCAICLDVSARVCKVEQPFALDDAGWPTFKHLVHMAAGQKVVFTGEEPAAVSVPESAAEPVVLPISEKDLAEHVKVGDELDLGRYLTCDEDASSVRLRVESVHGREIHCLASDAFEMRGHLIVAHLPTTRSKPSFSSLAHATPRGGSPRSPLHPAKVLSERDVRAIKAFNDNGILDFLIVGGVTSAEEVASVRNQLMMLGAEETKVLMTMKTTQSVMSFGNLAVLVDGVLLSRGWLGMHIHPEKIAVLQKRVIHCCNVLGKLCVVTRIADSMQTIPRPTRAEATDIANSILDGADAFLLGAQTMRGEHPVLCVRTVLGICQEAERIFDSDAHYERVLSVLQNDDQVTTLPPASTWVAANMKASRSTFFHPTTSFAATGHDTNGHTRHSFDGSFYSQEENGRVQLHTHSLHPHTGPTAVSDAPVPPRPSSARPPASTGSSHHDVSGPVSFPVHMGGTGSALLEGVSGGVSERGRPEVRSQGLGGANGAANGFANGGTNGAANGVANGADGHGASGASKGKLQAHGRGNTAAEFARGAGMLHPVASWGSLSVKRSPSDVSLPPAGAGMRISVDKDRDVDGDGDRDSLPAPPSRLTLRAAPATPHDNELLVTSSEVAAAAAVNLAASSGAKLLMVVTDSGHTASMVAKYKPLMPVVSLVVPRVSRQDLKWKVTGAAIARQCNFLRGVTSLLAETRAQSKGLITAGLQRAQDLGLVSDDDEAVVITHVGGKFQGTAVQSMNVGDVVSERGSTTGVLA